MRAAAVCAIALLLALVVAPPVLEASVWLAAAHDAAHVVTFAIIAALLCSLIKPRRAGYLALFAVAAVFAVGTELAQPYFAGAGLIEIASMGDVGRDLAGSVIGVLAWLGVRRHRPRLVLAAGALLLVCLLPLAFVGWAYAGRALHPDIVFDPGRVTWRVFIERTNAGTVARDPERHVLRFTATSDSFAGIGLREPPPDWRGYDRLVVAVSNPGATPLSFNVRIDDLPRNTEYEDRFNRERTVPPGASLRWEIPLGEIVRGPQGRLLDLSHITRVVLFLSPGSRGATFELAGVTLERVRAGEAP